VQWFPVHFGQYGCLPGITNPCHEVVDDQGVCITSVHQVLKDGLETLPTELATGGFVT
jgi:hypothetical protein